MSMDIRDKGVRSEINVTPLVDVVLVLLIIFMVVTPLLQRGKDVQLPQARRISELKSGGDPIFVSITRDKRIWLDKRETRKGDLAAALATEMARMPGAPILVKGDRDLDYRTIREVILEVTRTHALGVSLAATSPRIETEK